MTRHAIPYLKDIGDSKQLYVNGEPFLVLGAELHNSTASSMEFLELQLPKLADLNINTVFAPIAWEQIEEEEGVYDFAILDAMIELFRKYNMKIGLLWFGSFKNGESSYVPVWVKTDTARFPRSSTAKDGKLSVSRTLSVFARENIECDARVFTAMMQHLKEFDGDENTVIMVQVHNEVGVLWDSRDRSATADKEFKREVPHELISYLKKQEAAGALISTFVKRFPTFGSSGSWEEVFGEGVNTEEIFMAWHYAKYIDEVAAAGKAAYPLPMFTNACIATPESHPQSTWKTPGKYPSGGVVGHMLDVYAAACSSLDFYAPDIYDVKFEETCEVYRHGNNPLLVPEMRRDTFAAERVFYAFGACKAIGVSPFGIDSQWEKSTLFKSHYDIMRQIAPFVTAAQAENKICGFHFAETDSSIKSFKFGGITARVGRASSSGKQQTGFGVIIQTGPAEFLGAGFGFFVMFTHDTDKRVEILRVREGKFEDGKWQTLRWLNGDETESNQRWVHAFAEIDYGSLVVPKYYPAVTGITKCQVYVHPGELYGLYPLDEYIF